MGWNGLQLFDRTRGVLLFEGFIGAGENLKLNGTVIVNKLTVVILQLQMTLKFHTQTGAIF